MRSVPRNFVHHCLIVTSHGKMHSYDVFLALNAFRTRECEHLSLERYFLEFLSGVSVFFLNGFGHAGKGVDLT